MAPALGLTAATRRGYVRMKSARVRGRAAPDPEPESESAMKRWQSTLAGAVAAAALVIGGGGVAHADVLVAVDSLEAVVESVSLGSIACNQPAGASIKLAIKRSGGVNSTNTFADGSFVQLSAGSDPAGVAATIAAPSG